MGELVIRIDPDTARRLDRLSTRETGTSAEIALAAIMDRIQELEETPLALRRLQDIENGVVQPISHDEAMRQLGLED